MDKYTDEEWNDCGFYKELVNNPLAFMYFHRFSKLRKFSTRKNGLNKPMYKNDTIELLKVDYSDENADKLLNKLSNELVPYSIKVEFPQFNNYKVEYDGYIVDVYAAETDQERSSTIDKCTIDRMSTYSDLIINDEVVNKIDDGNSYLFEFIEYKSGYKYIRASALCLWTYNDKLVFRGFYDYNEEYPYIDHFCISNLNESN